MFDEKINEDENVILKEDIKRINSVLEVEPEKKEEIVTVASLCEGLEILKT